MAKQDNVIRLVLIEDAVEDAEQLVSLLRNGGIAVRPTRAESMEHLAEFLKAQPVDLVLANPKSKTIPLAKAASTVLHSGKDVPVIALVTSVNDDILVTAHSEGATRIALRNRPEHLLIAVKREFENVSMRRSTRRMEALLKESERRCTALLDSSRDPICFIHEGMHVRANQAYLDIFGFEAQEEIEGTPILDMIAPDAAAGFKELLKRLSKGEKPPAKLESEKRAATSAGRHEAFTVCAMSDSSRSALPRPICSRMVLKLSGSISANARSSLPDAASVTTRSRSASRNWRL